MSQPHSMLRDFLRRLSEWDVLNLAPGSGDDGPYWQGEIVKANAELDALEEQVSAYEDEINERTSDQALTLRKLREEQEKNAALEEQFEAYRSALEEVHDQLCGCDRPANPAACIAPEETWGAFALLKESNPASSPKEDA